MREQRRMGELPETPGTVGACDLGGGKARSQSVPLLRDSRNGASGLPASPPEPVSRDASESAASFMPLAGSADPHWPPPA
jgi:hypothetical protein